MALRVLLRSTLSLGPAEQCRAPKKKKQAEAKIESNDIINIFKDREDPVITDIREYPLFVHEYSVNKPKYLEQTMGIRWGSYANALQRTDWKRYLKGMQRLQIKNRNYQKTYLRKLDLTNDDVDMYSKFAIRDRFQGFGDDDDEEEEEVEEDDEEEGEVKQPKKREG